MLPELFATGAPELKPADLEACESTPPSSFCSAHHEAAAASCGRRDDACGLRTAADDVALLFVLLRRTIAALPSLSPCHSPPCPLKFYLIGRIMLCFFFLMVICEVDTPMIVAITQMLWSLGRRTDKQRWH